MGPAEAEAFGDTIRTWRGSQAPHEPSRGPERCPGGFLHFPRCATAGRATIHTMNGQSAGSRSALGAAMPRPLPPSRFRRVGKWGGFPILAYTGWLCCAIGCVVGLLGIAYYFSGLQPMRFRLWSVETKQAERRFLDFRTRAELRIKNGWIQYGHNEEWAFKWWFVPKGRLHIAVAVVAPWAAFGGLLLADRRRTIKPGHCLTCGYDLRASKKRCPECGTPIAPKPG